MAQQSHERDEIRKQLQPFFEEVIEAVYQAHGSDAPSVTVLEIARINDRLGAAAIVCPLEARVGMVREEWTPDCAEAMAYVAQKLPERAAAKVVEKLGEMNHSHNSFERVARMLCKCWEADRDMYEEATIQAFKMPDETAQLAVSIDRVSLLIDEEAKLTWRMAYCGTLTFYDGIGEPLKTL